MTTQLNWGLIGTGAIARAFAHGVAASKLGRVVAVGSRTKESADKFGDEFNIGGRHASYESLLADNAVQAVYISTPHPMHAEWAVKAAEAGKHILCEKPLGLNGAEAMAMIEAAARHNVFFMEAFMYRCHPQTARLVELIKSKSIGEVRLIQATFAFAAPYNDQSRLWNNALGGGGILDIGCYTTSISRLIAGAALSEPGRPGPGSSAPEKHFADPISVKGAGKLAPTGVDEYAAGILSFPNDITAQVTCAIGVNVGSGVTIFGTEGSITVPNPWTADRAKGGDSHIHVNRKGQPPEDIVIHTDVTAFTIESEVVAKAVAAGQKQPPPPGMTWDDSLGNARTLDAWKAAVGVAYHAETRAATRTITGRPLKFNASASAPGRVAGAESSMPRLSAASAGASQSLSPSHPVGSSTSGGGKMKYGQIAGIDKPISRLVMGVDNQVFMPHAAVMFDDFFERGGNCFDCSHWYGEKQQGNLAAWIRSRGVREQVVVMEKAGHTPFNYPKVVDRQITESLERYGTPYFDMLLLHRDNLDVPVSEFIDVLNEHQRAGRIRTLGASNWSIPRIEEANAYAKKKGMTGFTAVSNNFSLARMINAPWAGCAASSDPESRAWHIKTQTPLLPWSSQARGFFLPHIHPGFKDDPEVVNSWFSPDNFQRRDRAIELAKKRGVEPINIALAYVLYQDFPTFPLIGPRSLAETRSSFKTLEIDLTPQEVKWLNLEA